VLLVAAGAYAVVQRTARVSHAALPALPKGARYLSHTRGADSWLREGYVEMVNPIRPPSSEDGRTRISVYVRIPGEARIRVVKQGETGSLALPEGARAERVEFYGDGDRDAAPSASWRVLDVRGISFERQGQRLRVLRPTASGGNALLGIEWNRGEQHDAATTALGDLVLRGLVAAPALPAQRKRAAAHLRGLNGCPTCHVPQQPGRRSQRDPGIVNRGTDASGLFQVTSIMHDRLPFETYRPRDTNVGDPLITRFCGEARVDAATTRCPDGSILEGELNVRDGMQRGDLHTRRVCESRRALAQHLDVDARAGFHDSLAECGFELP
jgi:hypothetical protein